MDMNRRNLPPFLVPAVLILAGLVSLNLAQAASASYLALGKAQRFEQSSDSSVLPSDDTYAFKSFAIPTSPGTVFMGMVTPPNAPFPQFLMGEDVLVGEVTYSSLSDFEDWFPEGEYAFSLAAANGEEIATITLGAPAYPNTPQIANYPAAQAVDPSKDLVLNWNAFAGATGDDYVQLTVFDDNEEVVFQTPWPGQAGALNGSARSVAIPANSLNAQRNMGLLSFTRATRSTTALPGTVVLTTFASETFFSIRTGGGGDGSDTTPPTLLSSNPPLLAKNVSTNAPVVLTFSEPMAPEQGISWTGLAGGAMGGDAGLDESNFVYDWSTDGRTLTCTYPGGFPANTMIVWDLDPSAFLDRAGNELEGDELSGIFTTGSGSSGPNDPCDPDGEDDGSGSVTVFKTFSYIQESAAGPVLDPDLALSFYASVFSPETNPVTQATLILPNGASKQLENGAPGMFWLDQTFQTKEALDAAYPSGAYKMQMQRAQGTASVTVNLAAGDLPIPHITNIDAARAFDPKADFTLQWQPFTGAGKNDSINVFIYDRMGTTFNAPDRCVPRELKNTDTSVLVPKNTFSGFGTFDGSLTFGKYSSLDTNSVPDIVAMAGVSKHTSFRLGKPSTVQMVLQNFGRAANGMFHFEVKAPVNSTIIVEKSTDLANWVVLYTAQQSTEVLEVTDAEAGDQDRCYYRARTLF